MAGSTESGPMVAVLQFVEGFNNDEIEHAQAACADETSIIDDFPPHACTDVELRRSGIETWPQWPWSTVCRPVGDVG